MPRFRGFSMRSTSMTATTPSNDDAIQPTVDTEQTEEDMMSLSYPPPKNHPLHLFRGTTTRNKPRIFQSWIAGATNNKNIKNGGNDDVSEKADGKKETLTTSQSISTTSAYCHEWEKLFMIDDYAKKLKKTGMDGALRSSRFRSVCWKLYLESLPENRREWIATTRAWRKHYDDLKTKLIINPRKAMDKADLSINNPLSQESESPWNQFFQDNELRLTIKQDVIRTFPEIEFFRSESLRSMMLDILFCYAKINTKLLYKQGMHELLAPLIFVLHCDHQAFLHACELETIDLINSTERPVVKEILNPKYIEHDAFTMFCQIMGTVEPWYVSKEISPTVKNTNIFTAQPFARVQDMHPSNVIITKLTRIQDYVLKRFDPDLHAHLEGMEIAPQIYGIRWVRLLFGREFPMQDLLVMWDAIFADGLSFDLVDYIFVGMLQYIRELLLYSDYPTCLTTLMKFPPVGDVHYFVEKGVYLREPTQHPKPRDYVYTKQSGQMTNSQLLERVTKSYTRSEYRPAEKRGSTASLSKLDSGNGHLNNLQGASSTQSLAKLETSKYADSVTNIDQLSPEERTSPTQPPVYATLPTRGKNGKNSPKEASISPDITLLTGRLQDMEAMCKQCSVKMGRHIDKLQVEMMQQDSGLKNEDELLLALAGLKQVRDVLKGILKPCNIFEDGEINIRDNYYRDDTSSGDATPTSGLARNVYQSSPERRRAAHAATYRVVNNVDDESSPDSSSPEYSDNVRPEDSWSRASGMTDSWERKAEIEMTSLRNDVQRLHRQLSSASENGTAVSAGSSGTGVTHCRSGSNSNSISNSNSSQNSSQNIDTIDPNQNHKVRPGGKSIDQHC